MTDHQALSGRPFARSPDATTIIWSGGMPPDADDPSLPSVPNWSQIAWNQLTDALGALSAAPGRIAIRPHARHVVSDVPSCVRLLRHITQHPLPAVALAYDPASMLPPQAAASSRQTLDLLTRAYEALPDLLSIAGPHALAAVFVSGVSPPADAAHPITRPCPVHQGQIETTHLARLIALVPPEVPLILLDTDRAAQLAALQ